MTRPAPTAWWVVWWFGFVSLAADMVYEGARSVYGPVLAALGASALTLSACQTGAPVRPVGPVGPGPDGMIPETQRHQVALVIALSGPDGGVGTSIANAANLAVLDATRRQGTVRCAQGVDSHLRT